MQEVLLFQKIEEEWEKTGIRDTKKEFLKEHFSTHRTASFEWYSDFDLCSFDWYDINSPETDTERIFIYLDKNNLLIFCESADTQKQMKHFLKDEAVNSDRQLHYFLVGLLACDMYYIDNYEDIIVDAEDEGFYADHNLISSFDAYGGMVRNEL